MRGLCLLYKFQSTEQPAHVHNIFLQIRNPHGHPNAFHVFSCRTEYFKKSFFPHVIKEWNKVDPNISSSSNHNIFWNTLLKSIRPNERNIFNINDSFGIMLTRLGFKHLFNIKFRQNFQNILYSHCSCSIETETTTHNFLHYHFYNLNWAVRIDDLENNTISFLTVIDNNLISLLLYADDNLDDTKNPKFLMSILRVMKDSPSFNE